MQQCVVTCHGEKMGAKHSPAIGHGAGFRRCAITHHRSLRGGFEDTCAVTPNQGADSRHVINRQSLMRGRGSAPYDGSGCFLQVTLLCFCLLSPSLLPCLFLVSSPPHTRESRRAEEAASPGSRYPAEGGRAAPGFPRFRRTVLPHTTTRTTITITTIISSSRQSMSGDVIHQHVLLLGEKPSRAHR